MKLKANQDTDCTSDENRNHAREIIMGETDVLYNVGVGLGSTRLYPLSGSLRNDQADPKQRPSNLYNKFNHRNRRLCVLDV
jgi:hypothetical protein